MKRTYSTELAKYLGKTIMMEGRVYNIRKLGGITFVILQDQYGLTQCVGEHLDVLPKTGSVIRLTGEVKAEPRAPHGVEVKIAALNVINEPTEELPFDMSKNDLNLQLTTLLDYRPLTIRHEKVKAIFAIYDTVIQSYAEALKKLGFQEIKTPKILGAATEGGSNFFKVKYFEQEAFLAQSPQFYKQMCAGAFERVFEIGPVFRAEKHFTTRHVNEYISLDAEMAYIKTFSDIQKVLTKVMAHIFAQIAKHNQNELAAYGATVPAVPKKIPSLKLADAKRTIKEKYGYEIPADTDIDPEGERLVGRYAAEELGSDFVFLTHYPTDERPFYTMPNKKDPSVTEGFDLIFRGIEIATGGQRIHKYEQLISSLKKHGFNPESFDFYLQAFKYAMPPHGGWGMGSERIVYKLLGLETVKEAILFPRDVKRLVP